MAFAFVALGASFILTFLHSVSGQATQVPRTIVTNSDPQIVYSPALCSETGVTSCIGAWWDTVLANGSVIKTTAGPSSQYKYVQTTLSYSFYGSSLELHGLVDTDGANMVIQIDNFMAIINTSTGIGGASQQPYMLYNYSQLDPQTVHTLSVGWSANMNPNVDAGGYKPLSYAYFACLAIGDFRAVNSVSSAPLSSATSTPTEATLSTQPTSGKLNHGSLAGIILAILFFVMLFCVLLFYRLHHYRHTVFRRRWPASPHVKVIECLETRDASSVPSPTQIESWKARPHLSLPPAYDYVKERNSEKAGYGSEKGIGHLDLESDGRKSDMDPSFSLSGGSEGQKKRKSRSLSPVSLSPTHSPRAPHPPRAKLQVNTRASAIAPRNHPFAGSSTTPIQDEQERSPITPITPYCVGTATVARPQNAQLVPNPSLHGSRASASRQLSTVPLPPLPPTPGPREEKRHPSNLTSSRRSRKASRAHTSIVDKEGGASNALEVELHTMATTSTPPLNAMSVMTRSVPPPYTLHV